MMLRLLLLSLISCVLTTQTALGQEYHSGAGEGYQLIPDKPAFALIPGLYNDLDAVIGYEITLLYGIVGLAIGGQSGALYAEAEFVFGPLSIGMGPRWHDGGSSAQMTVALPFFFAFPYWRWHSDLPGSERRRHQEFGVMLKIPLGFSPAKLPKIGPRAADEII